MSATLKKTSRSTKKGAKGAKMLISVAALAVTFGGWIAMANDGAAECGMRSAECGATASYSALRTPHSALHIPQPPAPVAVTRSSR